jgi:phage protein U
MSAREQIGAGSNLPRMRGMGQASLDLIEAMRELAEPAQPITGRGVGYKLFATGLIDSMSRQNMNRVADAPSLTRWTPTFCASASSGKSSFTSSRKRGRAAS